MKTKIISQFLNLFYAGILCMAVSCKKDKPAPAPVPAPEISFTATVDASSSPVKVAFNNTSLNSSNVTWEWSFGDDSVSTEKSPYHYYYAPGTFTIKLKSKLNGTSLTEVTKTVTIARDLALRAWYKLDKNDPVKDFSGYDNTITGTIGVSSNDIIGHKGLINTAVELNLPNPSIIMPNGLISLQTVDASLGARSTISMWVYFKDLNGHNGLFCMYSGDVEAYVPVLFTSGRQLRGMFWDNPEPDFKPMSSGPANLLTENNWHHVAITGDPGGQSLYLDGKKVASRSKAITHLSMSTNVLGFIPVRPGGRWFEPEEPNIPRDAAYYLNGRLDDVRIYNKRLSDTEILALSRE